MCVFALFVEHFSSRPMALLLLSGKVTKEKVLESCQTKYLSPSGKYPKLRLIPFYCVNIHSIEGS